MCFKKQKTNVKVFSMIINKNEAKAIANHTSCDCESKFTMVNFNFNQKWNNKMCQCECKNYRKCKKDYS